MNLLQKFIVLSLDSVALMVPETRKDNSFINQLLNIIDANYIAQKSQKKMFFEKKRKKKFRYAQ